MERNTRNIKLGIGIPTLNRYDLLKSNLYNYSRDFNCPIYIVDNGNQGIEFDNVFVQEKNLGVAASWNFLCDKIFETCDYALILNDDIYLGQKFSQIQDLIKRKPNRFMRAVIDWCAFIMPKSVFMEVGRFDECFYPAYYEDKSYEYRMKLKGVPVLKTPELIPYVYTNSKTIEKDYKLYEQVKKNKQIYIQMWGGEPEREKFKTPYNKIG